VWGVGCRAVGCRPWSRPPSSPRRSTPAEAQNIKDRSISYCRTTSASTAPCTSRTMCCPTHCASNCAPCQPLSRAFSGWIRSPPPTNLKEAARANGKLSVPIEILNIFRVRPVLREVPKEKRTSHQSRTCLWQVMVLPGCRSP